MSDPNLDLAKARGQIADLEFDRRELRAEVERLVERLTRERNDAQAMANLHIESSERLGNELQTANLARTQLLAELAMYYPIAIQALATGSEESDLLELREMIDKIEKSTTAARIEYLPARLKKLGGGQ